MANAERLYGQSPASRFSLLRLNQARRDMFDGLVSVDKDPNNKFLIFQTLMKL